MQVSVLSSNPYLYNYLMPKTVGNLSKQIGDFNKKMRNYYFIEFCFWKLGFKLVKGKGVEAQRDSLQ